MEERKEDYRQGAVGGAAKGCGPLPVAFDSSPPPLAGKPNAPCR